MILRRLEASDLPSAKQVIASTGLFPPELLDEMAAPFLQNDSPAEKWHVVIAGDVLVGVAYCVPERLTAGTWNLLLIAVHSDRHGEGFGSHLLRHVETELEEAGERLLLVETSGLPGFAATRRFYEHRGYRGEARIRDFYQACDDKVVFCKRFG